MKSLLIDTVENGWLARPFTPSRDWAVAGDQSQIFVFRDIRDLQEQLPKLLSVEQAQVSVEESLRQMQAVDQPTCGCGCGSPGLTNPSG